ncbi:MAG: ribosome-binding factor A [Bacteroidetes bacterium RIFOXYB2_FULL_35_7]|nr:MAG: ribosome-binding factor A [Bacteroidetes bacterium GWF2_35_48]OFY92851.1 MAG: ribosome-binding factor A [Bacteroidetes bacterium RIFOXYB2_FULL_35_7]OFY98572.1 MAG: ribosome-binding factor A [Bacteroidetes bacterium RIFOXYC12_FULL_35_7]HBX51363.1 30S ribosome-binding factor RbfA [Bacteroidales bacterium]
MDNIRLNKISRLLQKELGDIFLKGSITLFGGAMITVTYVKVSPDLSVARASISIFSLKIKSEEVMELIQTNKSKIRLELGNRVRNQLRKIPDLIFYIDDSLDKVERIEKLLRGEDPDK